MPQQANTQYFDDISHALQQAGAIRPTLVIDKARLDQNIKLVKRIIDRGFAFRLVAKSLPSLPLIKYIMEKTGTNRLMSFHLPFLTYVATELPDSDILLGKPMPVAAAQQFYENHDVVDSNFNPETQLHWLIDSTERLKQYQQLALQLDRPMQVNLEIDVGLHRGGYSNKRDFEESLKFILASKHLKLTGLMGYEAYICKIPGFLGGPDKAFKNSQTIYAGFVNQIKEVFGPKATDDLILNSGGSSTYPLYDKPGLVNEIATASALVKPTDFDVFTLNDHLPAAFIATPVLKEVSNPDIPMASGLSNFLRKIGLSTKKACFIYGGNWLASPCHPEGAKRSNILGHSSNQELFDLPKDSTIKQDDFMFFRPSQSEAVLLQFGELAVYDQGKITDWWCAFPSERPLKNMSSPITQLNQNNN